MRKLIVRMLETICGVFVATLPQLGAVINENEGVVQAMKEELCRHGSTLWDACESLRCVFAARMGGAQELKH